MKRLFALFFLITTITFFSCTADDDADMINTVTMKVNGVTRTFEPLGYETELQQNGQYRLILSMYANDGLSEESATIVTTFGDTGSNGFQEFHITLNPSGFDSNLVQGNFSSNISTNTETEFEATFLGTMGNGNETVTITNGRVHFLYDEPLGI